MLKLIAPLLLATLAVGCSSKVQQQRPPRIEDEDEEAALKGGGQDIAAEPEAIKPTEEKVITPEEQKAMCCSECATAVSNDRSGDDPKKIPCVDFTAELSKPCLKWFRDNQVMASDAAACAGPPKTDAGASATTGASADDAAK